MRRSNVKTLDRDLNIPKYRPFTLKNFKQIPQVQMLSREQKFETEVVGQVLPFRINSYVVDELIRWDDIPNDPMYILTFPQREMLREQDFEAVASALKRGVSKEQMNHIVQRIRLDLNPHPAGQMEQNVPWFEEDKLTGMQHKYRQTVLFFPSQGQVCHAYCSFCFRWPQFVGVDEWKFAMREIDRLLAYIESHPEVTDVLFTGGDPLVMKSKLLAAYVDSLLKANPKNLRTIRIGTKALSYWPYRFVSDSDAKELLDLFRRVIRSGRHLAFMAHFNHPRELETWAVQEAIARIRETGAEIRTQSPLLAHINDQEELWARMWEEQVRLGCIPYYMFVERDTGAQHYFGVSLARAWQIFRNAYQQVSGIARTVRGPSMSANPGKVQVLGVTQVRGEKVFALQFLQGRDPDWVLRPFFAKFDPEAIWLDELEPAFGEERFFFDRA